RAVVRALATREGEHAVVGGLRGAIGGGEGALGVRGHIGAVRLLDAPAQLVVRQRDFGGLRAGRGERAGAQGHGHGGGEGERQASCTDGGGGHGGDRSFGEQ